MAMQYAGSGAMHKVDGNPNNKTVNDKGDKGDNDGQGQEFIIADGTTTTTATTTTTTLTNTTLLVGAQNAIVAVQRYYSNISSDFERQQSIDLMLGQ